MYPGFTGSPVWQRRGTVTRSDILDVILLDVSLRGEDGNQTLNGMETARKIRETSNAMIIL